MPPKVRANRKLSSASKAPSGDATTTAAPATTASKPVQNATASSSMPPPPPPRAMLEPEVSALSDCMRNAVVKTGQVYRFYADTRRLGIHRQAPFPPRSLTASLGHEVEKYDQLCDAIESQLLRALSVLRRDLEREEARLKAAESAAVATRTRSKTPSMSPTTSRIPLPAMSSPEPLLSDVPPSSDPSVPDATQPSQSGISPPSSRRPSAISLSSLHRAPFPLKLDLSSSTFRFGLGLEDGVLGLGMAPLSPVALAPSSARPSTASDFPPDFMAALANAGPGPSTDPNQHVDIDLTLPDAPSGMGVGSVDTNMPNNTASAMDVTLGSSPDKPIELDLDSIDIDMNLNMNMNIPMEMDMSGLFDNTPSADADGGLFTPTGDTPLATVKPDDETANENENFNMEILEALGSASDGDIFKSFSNQVDAPNTSSSQSQTLSGSASSVPVPSPAAILAALENSSSSTSQEQPGPLATSSLSVPGGSADSAQFDISSLDFSGLSPGMFSSAPGEADSEMAFSMMEELMNLGGDDLGMNLEGNGKNNGLGS